MEGFYPARRLEDLFLSGKEKQVEEPEEYAVKNWIVRVQGFLIGCATHGFTENYPSIMEGSENISVSVIVPHLLILNILRIFINTNGRHWIFYDCTKESIGKGVLLCEVSGTEYRRKYFST